MAFIISCKDSDEASKVVKKLNDYLEKSRFTIRDIGIDGRKVFLRTVRLRQPKGYCGNHAGPCRVTGGKHRKLPLLEGMDWVSFNDMLNDMLDKMRHRGSAASSHCIIRKDGKRRAVYDGQDGGEFLKDALPWEYVDNIGGKRMVSEAVGGTPGIRGYSRRCKLEACSH